MRFPARRPMGRLLGLGVIALAALMAVGAVPAAGQTLEQEVVTRRLEYQAARAEYQAATAAFNVVDQRFNEALSQFSQAKRGGDPDVINQAFAEAQTRSFAEAQQQARVTATAETLRTSRQALIDALSARLEELLNRIDDASSNQVRQGLQAIYRDHYNELQNLDAEAQAQVRLTPVVLPDITYDPRDSSVELVQKAEILERRAAIADTLISDTDRTIKQYQERQRLERQRRDFMAGTGRFDDTRTPVLTGGTGGNNRAGDAAADSTLAGARPVTLEERIAELQEHREQLVDYRDQLLIRAAEFRRHVRMVT